MTGWDAYAPYYDWENGLTIGRRDVAFWQAFVRRERRPTLELGSGTGRLLVPMARACRDLVGVDYSSAMLARARRRIQRLPRHRRPALVRGDMRALPFPPRSFGAIVAGYGVLQSLLNDQDLDGALAEAARVLPPGGRFGIDLVPDLPAWTPYTGKVSLRGKLNAGTSVTLIESVRQDRRRGLTIFDERFVERRGRHTATHEFSLTFRTLPMPEFCRRLERAGLHIEAMLGDYRGGPWAPDAAAWIVLATKRRRITTPRKAGGF